VAQILLILLSVGPL